MRAAQLHDHWNAASAAYYVLHTDRASTPSRDEALRWREAHPHLYDQFLTLTEEAYRAASAARHHAWAPYSRFPVGAALLATDGSIWNGCNVECSSYGLTLCAERVALGHAVTNGRRSFVVLVLVTDTEAPISPCGACRQLLHDFSPGLLIVAEGTRSNRRALWWLAELLPAPFSGKDIWQR
jgi:cytidine deaminase